MEDIQTSTIQLRLEGIRQAITRARFTLLVSIIISVSIIITVWNAYLSWDSGLAMQPHWSHDKYYTKDRKQILDEAASEGQGEIVLRPLNESGTAVTDYAQQQVVSEWVKNRVISVGLLGIRVSVTDLSVLGSLSLFITSVWLFFSIRRENRAIGTLLRDVYLRQDVDKNRHWNIRYMVYQGVVHNLVFVDLGRGDKPITDYTKEESDEIQHLPGVRRVVKALFFLAPFSIFFVIFMDVLTLVWLEARLRPSHITLLHVLPGHIWSWVAGMLGFGLVLGVATSMMSYKTLKFTNATGDLLKNFRKELKDEKGEQRVND